MSEGLWQSGPHTRTLSLSLLIFHIEETLGTPISKGSVTYS